MAKEQRVTMVIDPESVNCDPGQLDAIAILSQIYCDENGIAIDVDPRYETGGGGIQMDCHDPYYHYMVMLGSKAVEWAWSKIDGRRVA